MVTTSSAATAPTVASRRPRLRSKPVRLSSLAPGLAIVPAPALHSGGHRYNAKRPERLICGYDDRVVVARVTSIGGRPVRWRSGGHPLQDAWLYHAGACQQPYAASPAPSVDLNPRPDSWLLVKCGPHTESAGTR